MGDGCEQKARIGEPLQRSAEQTLQVQEHCQRIKEDCDSMRARLGINPSSDSKGFAQALKDLAAYMAGLHPQSEAVEVEDKGSESSSSSSSDSSEPLDSGAESHDEEYIMPPWPGSDMVSDVICSSE